ncbi:bifunctional diaminohydroxyphosphoribosylaminopyrimidine deaminase/5-amino-6-(5-phosphoribosylamino)uracil reductase RibD [Chitinophaga barathri]|uniref:Riboflavin biosynthesis protein RibD n=1 Tax=Chitinophaga barathri TaxID=1647451 RepID=A0A3N4M4N2_9BACT|nr:bifunctional diaminohydroxyphosphoribosylaminopyrimidine deaminase/5-amino-6-(5-phosphoribosylamino)uracil reductase RibD [Chitinophaga barathri]RPD38072.1 bifunctional diaminohydroxyphosphoribosylaminopyrimidine deaminase/5-amino-6-(5-phosphoribosylamino)uracil reductase RibD [Chitinophaga barathri]
MHSNSHEIFMQRCISLALNGEGMVAPNPMVGAVLVHEGRIIGEGFHRLYGEAHAEVNCVNSVEPELQELIPRSIMYVSLEPCAHHGKTPPCADLIIAKNIPEVVIGCVDSFSRVAGKGIEKLREAGVKVTTGVLEAECRYLNRRFFTFHEQQRPYVILKWAQSPDGFMAPPDGKPVRISGPYADRLVHQWRSREAGIMVGTQTALKDNPRLNTRLWPGKSPVRIVLDLDEKIPRHFHLHDGSVRTIFITGKEIDRSEELLPQVMAILHKESVQSIIVEGGANLLQQFINSGTWDELRVITGQEPLGNGLRAPYMGRTVVQEKLDAGGDQVAVYGRPTARKLHE